MLKHAADSLSSLSIKRHFPNWSFTPILSIQNKVFPLWIVEWHFPDKIKKAIQISPHLRGSDSDSLLINRLHTDLQCAIHQVIRDHPWVPELSTSNTMHKSVRPALSPYSLFLIGRNVGFRGISVWVYPTVHHTPPRSNQRLIIHYGHAYSCFCVWPLSSSVPKNEFNYSTVQFWSQ